MRLRIRFRKALALGLSIAALVGGVVAVPSATAFTGHHCSRHTCRFFTSSYHTAKYFYDRKTCNQWKDLEGKYLNGFRTKKALKHHFNRKLHKPC